MNLTSVDLESFLRSEPSSSTSAPQYEQRRIPLVMSTSWSTSKSVKVLAHIVQTKEARFVVPKSSVSIFRRILSSLYLITFTSTCVAWKMGNHRQKKNHNAFFDAFDRLDFNKNEKKISDRFKDIQKFFKSRPSRKLSLNSFRNGNSLK